MTDDQIKEKEAELRRKNPGMFRHPDLLHGEVILRHEVTDSIDINVDIYNKKYAVRARAGRTPKDGKYLPFIVPVRDLIIAEDKFEKEQAA